MINIENINKDVNFYLFFRKILFTNIICYIGLGIV